ncbi:hypothetical protein KCMC57_64070 (plasmid) [Kitasatospora sp. CMC57]|uniref:Uncharacterized protein n=1 Tax=Kitasatospora sp. CMC57 TaxID=3231513 RepID=A0AB33K8P2_9ACTN
MLRWIRAWRRRRRGVPTRGQQAASSALHRAECARDAGHERAPLVSEAAAELRAARRENHFAERIRLTLEGGR